MKKLFPFSLFLFFQFQVFAVIDTLRHYDPAKTNSFTLPTTYPKQYAVFNLPASGYIKSVILTLIGPSSNGSVTMHIYGQEGGVFFPSFQKDLIAPMVAKKTASGTQKVQLDLATPLPMNNNMFFIKLENFSTGVALMKDNVVYPAFCNSSNGGEYHYLAIENVKGDIYYDVNAFAIDVIIDYTDGKSSPQYLKDITADAGIKTDLGNSSVSWADINNDHYPDLFVAGKLYKNKGNGTFTDITTGAGINTPAHTTTFIDINNDGKDDILFLHPDNTYNTIYINNGDETFTKQPLRLTTPNFSGGVQALAVADFNNDGYPDFFAGQLWSSTTLKDSANTYIESYLPHYLYMNDKNLGFIDKSALIVPDFLNRPALIMPYDSALGAQNLVGTNRCVRGAQWVDYNDDGQMDLYIANYRLQQDELWRNNGDGTFTDVCKAKKIDIDSLEWSGHGTGVDWADFDNDGDMDLLLPQLAHPENIVMLDHRPTTIYQNNGAPDYNFTDLNPDVNTGNLGIEYEETHAGANWGDLNNDGLLDFAICAFYGCRYSDVYIQKPDHTFEMKSFAYGLQNVNSDADMTLVDFDNDGKLDYAGGSNGGKFTLFKNQGTFRSNYVELNLMSTSGNKDAIGAKVALYAGGKKYIQYQMPYHGAKMSKGNRIHIGLGEATKIDSVVVRWPNGTLNSEKFTGLAINNLNTLTEGGGVKVGNFQTIIWDGVGVKEENSFLSNLAVYPNPASTDLFFNYELATNETVSLTVYSVLGEKITVVNNEKQTAGQHVIQWNIKDKIASGIYTYRLQVGELQKAGKLIVQ